MRTLSVLFLLGCSLACRPVSAQRELLDLHADVLRAHLESDPDLLPPSLGDFVQANRGELSRPDAEASRARFADYLGRTRFTVYRDQVPPVVHVSGDRTAGWVIVQVEARGEQRTPAGTIEPVSFQSAWVELYVKQAGRWLMAGNVSNFKGD
jgi:hypothetical protein